MNIKTDKKILLLIEDNPLLSGMYQTVFEKNGVSVILAHDGETGIYLAKKNKPKVILLDLLMPGIDGFEVLKELKKDSSTKDIKVVVLTVMGKESFKKKAEKLGVADYIIKSDLKLAEIVARVINYF